MNRLFNIAFLVMALLAISCKDKQDATSDKSPFASLEKYFADEIKTLATSNRSLQKIIYIKGKTEEMIIENPDWARELVPFTDAISGKHAYKNSFKKDSVIRDNKLMLNYTPLDASVEIKKLSVYKTDGVADSVIIIKSLHNMYYAASDTLKYYGNGNYRLSTLNDPTAGKKIRFVLEGTSRPANGAN